MECPYCGLKLNKTNWGRYFCPNCGIIDTNEDKGSNEDQEEDYGRYIG